MLCKPKNKLKEIETTLIKQKQKCVGYITTKKNNNTINTGLHYYITVTATFM